MIRKRRNKVSVVVALLWFVSADPGRPAGADDWPGPQVQNVFSQSGRVFARILPGKSFGDTVGFRGARTGAYAIAELFKRQPDRSYKLIADIALVNPVSPTDALLSDDGYLVTFDNWHNVGYGKVVAIYNPSGALIKSYELTDLYRAEKIKLIRASISSRYWRCRPSFVSPNGRTVYVSEALGGDFQFELATGTVKHSPGTRSECVPPVLPFSWTAVPR